MRHSIPQTDSACAVSMVADGYSRILLVFPEMRTTLRTYHPVPALQKTEGSLQDAPRIKNTLKACLLPKEAQAPPSTPSDVLAILVCSFQESLESSRLSVRFSVTAFA